MNTSNQLYKKINACWIGKNIGGTLGGPTEGTKDKLNMTDLPDLGSKGALPNDDLDLQLVNLHTIEKHGVYVTTRELSEEWKEHVYFPFDEYGYASTNVRKGFVSPLSGFYNNSFTDCMGSPIRSELWAAIAPGKPETAVYFAYQDSMVDHVGGEGLYGEIFFAALESLAYVNNDINYIVGEAIKYIPGESKTAFAVKDTFKWFNDGVGYDEIRDKILEKYGNANFTDVPQNIAFTVVGLLYGKDFKDCLLKAVNLGYDTDCTAATLGAILGILYGESGIPQQWADAVGQSIKVSYEIQGFDYPKTISELTERTVRMKEILDLSDTKEFHFEIPQDFSSQIFTVPQNATVSNALAFSVAGAHGPIVIPGKAKEINTVVVNNTFGDWDFNLTVSDVKGNTLFEQRMQLKTGDKKELKFEMSADHFSKMTSSCIFTVTRYYNDDFWTEYSFRAFFPVASKWEIDGNTVWGEEGHTLLEGIGKHTAKTILNIPSERAIKLVCAVSEPVRVLVDGKAEINTKLKSDYIPAYHRRTKERTAIIDLKAGKHEIVIEVESNRDKCDVMLMPTAPDSEHHYLSYYYVDCLIGEEDL